MIWNDELGGEDEEQDVVVCDNDGCIEHVMVKLAMQITKMSLIAVIDAFWVTWIILLINWCKITRVFYI